MKTDIAVIGGGAAGMLAALFAQKTGAHVTLIERNDRLGLKVGLTGKGRCNVTNNCSVRELVESVPGNGRFLYSAFSFFDSQMTMAYFESLGVPLKVERGNRVFPVSEKATDLVLALRRALEARGVRLLLGNRVKSLEVNGDSGYLVRLPVSEVSCHSVIIATGGLSYPRTGSTGDGYTLAGSLGHTVVQPSAALVPLEAKEPWVKELMGLSLRNVTLSSPVGEEFGEMLFTHFGISGPSVLTLSSHIVPALKQGPMVVTIDLKPALSQEQLDERIRRDFAEVSRKSYKNSLDKLLPSKLIPVMVNLSGIDPLKPVNQITRQERETLVSLLKALPITLTRPRPVEEAIVTSGGVSIREIAPQTMESKLSKNLYFCGEVMDADGYTGGFNLQIAWSSGAAAGNAAGLAVSRRGGDI